MAETRDQTEPRREGRRGKETRGEARQSFERAAGGAAAAMGEAAQAGAETARRGLGAAGEAMEQGAQGGREAAQQGMDQVERGMREIVESTASDVDRFGHRLAETTAEARDDMRRLMTLPMVAASTMHQLQQAMTNLTTRAFQAHVRATQEVFRLGNTASVFELNRRVARRYMSDMVEGSAEILRLMRRAADQALRPLEEGQEEREHEHGGRVADVMTPMVELAKPDQSVQEAAQLMASADTGALPVGEDDRLVGMITDRDIALRVAAEGKNPQQTRVREVMSPEVRYCFEDEDLDHVAENMADQQLRRLPVMNRAKRLVGMVSLGDISARSSPELGGMALHGVAQPGNAQRAFAGTKPGQSDRQQHQGEQRDQARAEENSE